MMWTATDPDGIEYRFQNLREFCRNHGLETSGMHLVATGKITHNKGWRCFKVDPETGEIVTHPKLNKNTRRFRFPFSPQGVVVVCENLKDFAIEHDLLYKQIHEVVAGIRVQHRGWTKFHEMSSNKNE